MATSASRVTRPVIYPTSDGKPMAETDWHRDLMLDLIQILDHWFSGKPRVYVSGNLLIYFVPGDKRRHVAPDVFVVVGVPKKKRDYYLTWEEGKFPSVIIELTSKSTAKEDTIKKFELYRDVFKVKEYFLFDPRHDYLQPRLQGFRLQKGVYVPIPLVEGRMPSKTLGLHLEENGTILRLYDPTTGQWLPTPKERAAEAEEQAHQAEEQAHKAEYQAHKAEEHAQKAEKLAHDAEVRAQESRAKAIEAESLASRLLEENQRLRRELEMMAREKETP